MKFTVSRKILSIWITTMFTLAICVVLNAQNIMFVSDLKLGSTGPEVMGLQKILNSDPATAVSESGVGSPGNETDYFGPKTHAAVIRFQEKHRDQILTPIGLTAGTGVVGAMTRAVLNGNGAVMDVVTDDQAPTVEDNIYPIITSVEPGVLSDPAFVPVTIHGGGFLADNTVFLSVQDLEIFNGPSFNGQTITVYLKTAFIDIIRDMVSSIPVGPDRQNAILALKREFDSVGMDGVYVPAVIFVQNKNGESNKFQIKINILKDADVQ